MDDYGMATEVIAVTVMSIIWPLLASGVLSGLIARIGKNRSFWAWFIYGCILPVISQIHVLFVSKRILVNSEWKRCPYCGEAIFRDAILCKHCKKDIPSVIERNP